MKNYNFPDVFPIRKISHFEFGSNDAFNDDLLSDTFCFTNAAKYSTHNNRSFIVGPPGSGKSAIFKAYMDRILKPKDYSENYFLIIGISDELKYLHVEEIIKNNFNIYTNNEDDKYILLWDAFILFKLLLEISDNFGQYFEEDIKKLSNVFGRLQLSKESTFRDFLNRLNLSSLEIKWKYGEAVLSGKAEMKDRNRNSIDTFDIVSIKNRINETLENAKCYAWVMIDKIDDFVLGKDYQVQKKLLRGLICCEDRFSDCSRIFLKLFIRADLFIRIGSSIEQIDKLDDKIVRLFWNSKEIRRFMARRLVHNYVKYLEIDISSILKDEIYGDEIGDEWETKEMHFKDKMSNKMIRTVFPNYPFHFSLWGGKEDIEINKFFDTHLSLSDNNFSPRVMRRFLEICFEKANNYYLDNPGEEVKKLRNNEYPLIKKQSMHDAFISIVNKTITWTLSKAKRYDNQWHDMLATYFNQINSFDEYNLYDFCNKLHCDIEHARIILAFLEHVGAVKCIKADRIDWLQSVYKIPLFYRSYTYHRIWNLELSWF